MLLSILTSSQVPKQSLGGNGVSKQELGNEFFKEWCAGLIVCGETQDQVS